MNIVLNGRGELANGDRRYYNRGSWYTKARRIIEGCDGRSLSYVHSRVKLVMKHAKMRPISMMREYIDRIVGYTKDNKPVIINYTGREEVAGRWHRHVMIEDNGKVKRLNLSYMRPVPRVFNARRYYATITHRRKLSKEHKKSNRENAIFVLKLINKPTLYPFYCKIWKRRQEIVADIARATVHEIRDKDNKYYRANRWYRRWVAEKRKETQMELNRIDNDLEKFRTGDFSRFFESPDYLYSLHKECHHAIPTPHLKPPIG